MYLFMYLLVVILLILWLVRNNYVRPGTTELRI
jgi:hypothetical protein